MTIQLHAIFSRKIDSHQLAAIEKITVYKLRKSTTDCSQKIYLHKIYSIFRLAVLKLQSSLGVHKDSSDPTGCYYTDKFQGPRGILQTKTIKTIVIWDLWSLCPEVIRQKEEFLRCKNYLMDNMLTVFDTSYSFVPELRSCSLASHLTQSCSSKWVKIWILKGTIAIQK